MRASISPQFDPEAANFHLVVQAPEVFDHPFSAIARQVAGAVQALAGRTERVGQETFGSQAWALEVAARQAITADQQLAGHADRGQGTVLADDVQAGVVDRPPQPWLAVETMGG